MRSQCIGAAIFLACAAAPLPAFPAATCAKGALAGAAAGVLAKHPLLGAAAGCAAGHYMAAKQAAAATQGQDASGTRAPQGPNGVPNSALQDAQYQLLRDCYAFSMWVDSASQKPDAGTRSDRLWNSLVLRAQSLNIPADDFKADSEKARKHAIGTFSTTTDAGLAAVDKQYQTCQPMWGAQETADQNTGGNHSAATPTNAAAPVPSRAAESGVAVKVPRVGNTPESNGK